MTGALVRPGSRGDMGKPRIIATTGSPARPGRGNQLFFLQSRKTTLRETLVLHRWTTLTVFSVLVSLFAAPAVAQPPAWAPADLVAAARAEGNAMTVYGS